MEYQGFGAAISYNGKEGRFDGRVVGATADLHFTGKSINELEKAFKEACERHLARCKAKHQEAYKKFGGTIITRIDEELHRDAFLTAQRDDMSLNKWVLEAIREKVSRSKPR